MIRRLLFAFMLFYAASLNAQKASPQIKALNNYVDFTNDCIHGLSIVHIMMQNFNNEVNNYVDDDNGGYIFKNSDFGKDIYNDISYFEHRQKTPEGLYPILLRDSKYLTSEESTLLNGLVTKMFVLAKDLNNLRFETEAYMQSHDVSDPTIIANIYRQLEAGVSKFDIYYELRNKLEVDLNNIYTRYYQQSIPHYNAFRGAHKNFTDILYDLRVIKSQQINSQVIKMQRSASELKSLSTRTQYRDIHNHALSAHKGANEFNKAPKVPENYLRYGKHYYYYNQVLLFKLNTIGAGMAYKMNEVLEDNSKNALRFLEVPALFKVLYPRKKVATDVIETQGKLIVELPKQLEERKIVSSENAIKVDNEVLELQLYDHMLLDGDIVSINFNGEWILKNQSLEKKPFKVKLKLNKEGKNYILLHAENEGIKPPNTMAVSYFYKGRKKEVLMKSSMKTSEMLEFVID